MSPLSKLKWGHKLIPAMNLQMIEINFSWLLTKFLAKLPDNR